MNNSYEITLRQEVLTEYASRLVSRYYKYIDENNISDNDITNKFVQNLNKISTIVNDILFKYDTKELLDKVELELKEYHNFIEEVK